MRSILSEAVGDEVKRVRKNYGDADVDDWGKKMKF